MGKASVDILIVLYNSSKFLEALLDSLRRITIPVNVYFLDNASGDDTVERLAAVLPELPFPVRLLQSIRNNGFARGVNLLARQSRSEFMFLLNPDAELEDDCLEGLLARIESDPKIAAAEARQQPREHPKTYDPRTGETSWCTGAAVLVRRTAFEQAGGFDERAFFMYCEDIDLSWKFWLSGWRCVYVPNSVVRHYTQDILPGKKRTWENYFSFRNSLFVFYRFGSLRELQVLVKFLLRRFVSGGYSLQSRLLYGFAFVEHIRYIPYLLRTRYPWRSRKHPWIRFEETSLAD